jgi:hypothetical protein
MLSRSSFVVISSRVDWEVTYSLVKFNLKAEYQAVAGVDEDLWNHHYTPLR